MVLGEIRKGVYGLPHAGRLSYSILVAHLAEGGYVHTEHAPGLFRCKNWSLIFCLIIDYFGMKYIHKHDAQYLINHLSKFYKSTVDWEGKVFYGL